MSWVAVAIGGSAVVGAVVAGNSSSKAADAANRSTDASLSAAQLQYDLGKETLEFQKDYYKNTLAPMQERDLKLREDLQAELVPSLQQQRQFAQEQNDYYKTTFQPIEKQVAADAAGYDSDSNVNRRMGIASAAVNQQFSNAQQQGARALARYGINPNSSAFARENAKLTTAQALGSAGAQSGAAFDTQDKAIALRAGVANFGRNMPNTAANYYGLGNQTAGTSSSVSATGVNTAGQAVSPMLSGSQIASAALTGAGRTINDTFSNQMKMYQADMQGVSGLFSGLGSFAATRVGQDAIGSFGNRFSNWYGGGGTVQGDAYTAGIDASGMYADGGAIRGPGGPRDDLIDIKASNGEFMLNEGAVRHFGLAKLEKMNEIGLQNQERRGLRGA
jgi:hypothetical protein